jgi:hypothetical protein
MDIFDFIAIFALTVTTVVIVVGGWYMIEYPGKVAEERKHPRTTAVRVCGWMGLFTAGLFWAAAMVWAYYPGIRGEEERPS